MRRRARHAVSLACELDARFGDDTGDELVGGDVEGWIEDVAFTRRNGKPLMPVGHTAHFGLVALLDDDLIARHERLVEGRMRRGDKKRHAVIARDNRERIGPDLVCHVAVSAHAVGARR